MLKTQLSNKAALQALTEVELTNYFNKNLGAPMDKIKEVTIGSKKSGGIAPCLTKLPAMFASNIISTCIIVCTSSRRPEGHLQKP